MNKWMLKRNKANIELLSKVSGVKPIVANILANRGIVNPKDIVNFIHPSIESMYNTLDIEDMKKAIDFISNSINRGDKIAIYGDYDADGIMSTIILYKGLKYCNADVIYYIPDRETEGYGINMDSVYKLHTMGINTIFTCDNGIAAIDEIAEAKKLGMNVIVLDHHEVRYNDNKQLLPEADAIIDPKRDDCKYPFKNLCAGGLAYKFICEFYNSLGLDKELSEKFIVYAMIASVCDIVDLVDENRIIVKQGLELIKYTQDIGLKTLIEETGLIDKKIGVYHVGFILGPCINATGRLEQATTAVQLFTTEDEIEAKDLANKLIELNNSRKLMTTEAVKKSIEFIEKSNLNKNKVLVIYNEFIHESIAGIVAGKIKETYYLPTIVLTKGEKMAKGSARSIEEYNIFDELCKCSELLDRFGGHKMAAGMSLEYKNIGLLREKLNTLCTLTEEDIIPKIRIDAQLPLEDIDFELIEDIDKLAPFGRGNETPLFAQKNIKILRVDFIGKEKKILKFQCEVCNNRPITAISFDGYNNFKDIIINEYGEQTFNLITSGKQIEFNLDMIYTININEFNGNKQIQMLIKDFRISN